MERLSREAKMMYRSSFSHEMDDEKEYHFDEGVGVSLDQHISDLKEKYPDATVQTRRDRDGFAIVKVSYRPEYKYDLDQIMAMNDEEREVHQAETIEAILACAAGGENNPAELLKSRGPDDIQRTINTLRGDVPSTGKSISNEAMLSIRKLAHDRA
mmetsp:Transcript_23760/g.31805  ORF Transcript_23760/g.31805 Transcript_23760/m.31805 type:complete len:156 (-) Transcript_23760:1227-1694(-)